MHREYGAKRLWRADLDPDPVLQFHKWFEEGSPTVLEPNAMAFATADAQGRPSLRMVLMKEFDDHGIVFATSELSRKGREMAANPRGAVLFYWPELERQVRATGAMEHTGSEESDDIFNHRSRASRIAARVSHQSAPIGSREELDKAFEAEAARLGDKVPPRPETWHGYRLVPEEFEFWQGGANRLHDRLLYAKGPDGWQIVRLQP